MIGRMIHFCSKTQEHKKIREIQMNAMKRLDAGEDPADTLIYFLKKSSFFRIIEDSLGISSH